MTTAEQAKSAVVGQLTSHLPRLPHALADEIAEDVLSALQVVGNPGRRPPPPGKPSRRWTSITPGQECEGGCGRRLRTGKMALEECPGTVLLSGAHRCFGCHRDYKWEMEFGKWQGL